MVKYLPVGDISIIKSWVSITLDGVSGVDQKSNIFWEEVFKAYVESFGNKNDKTVYKLQNRFGTWKKDKFYASLLRNFYKNNASEGGIEDI
ncbi:hypothetical protein MKX01_032735, partial [Papaver californicum]